MRLKNFTLNEQRNLARLLKLNTPLTHICKETEKCMKSIKFAAKQLGYKYIDRNWVR